MKKKKVLIVHAHPEPTSLTRRLVEVGVQTLQQQGHEVLLSDLYGMHWKAVFDEHDFPSRADPQRLSFIKESGHSYSNGRQATDIASEQRNLLATDAVIFQFPLWWFGMPAILKGWVDRLFAYGLAYGFYPDGHVLATHVAVGQSGLLAHIAEMQTAPQSLGRFVATLPPTARRRSAFLLRDHKSPCLCQFRSLGIAIRRQCLQLGIVVAG